MSLITPPRGGLDRRRPRPASTSWPITGPSGARPRPWPSRSSPRTSSSSRCPTPARSSGTSPTRPGSSRPSSSSAALPDYRPRYPQYNFLFNSYYNAIGERIARDRAGPALPADDRRGLALPRRRSTPGWRTGSGRPTTTASRRLAPIVDPRPAPRAAAPGIDPHRPQARLRQQPAPPGLSRARRPTSRARSTPLGWIAYPGRRPARSATREPGSPSTTRRPGIPSIVEAFELAEPAGHERRVPRLHRRRRLRPARVLALRRLGRPEGPRLVGPALLGAGRRSAG